MPRISTNIPLVLTIGVLMLAAVFPADAQTTIYPTKYVCGFQPGNVTLLSDPNPNLLDDYVDVKPGNYATTVNAVNLCLTPQLLYPFVTDDEYGGPFALPPVTVQPFQAFEEACPVIRGALPPDGPLGVIKGYTLFLTASDCFEVTGVYTYESQNAFERHVLWGLQDNGAPGVVISPSWGVGPILGSIPDPVPNPGLDPPVIAGSGAGGLGLGASIDLERSNPRTLPEPLDVVLTQMESSDGGR